MFTCTDQSRFNPSDEAYGLSWTRSGPGRSASPSAGGAPVQNGLLRTLPLEAFEELRPCLERVTLKRRQILHERNLPVAHAYFLERGLASLLARAGDSDAVEVGTLGHKDLAGLPVVLGTTRTPHRCVMQVPGEALRIKAEDLHQAVNDLPALRQLLLCYVQAASVQGTQLVVCNTRHTLRQRLARWLLFAHDRIEGDEIALTHQILGRALGVRRAGVTTAIGHMEAAGLVHRGRGRILILNREGLEREACECYRALRLEHGRITCEEGSKPRPGSLKQ